MLSRIQPNRRLERWLGDRARQMETLSLDTEQESSRLAVSLVQALDEAREFHQLEANLQVTQYLAETKEALLAMIRLAGAEDGVLVQLQILSDFRLELLTNLCKDFTVIDGPSRGLLRDCKIFGNLRISSFQALLSTCPETRDTCPSSPLVRQPPAAGLQTEIGSTKQP